MCIRDRISLGGIKKGVEKCCKILLPALFVVLLVVDIRVFTLDGIAEGLNYYLSFDIKLSLIHILMDTILVVSIFILVLLVLVQLLHCRDRRTMTNRQCA